MFVKLAVGFLEETNLFGSRIPLIGLISNESLGNMAIRYISYRFAMNYWSVFV